MTVETTGGLVSLILSAGPVAKVILLILLLFSVVSWTIMFKKWRQFKGIEMLGDAFIGNITVGPSLDRLVAGPGDERKNPFLRMFFIARKEASIRKKENRPMSVETIMAIKSVMQAVETEETAVLGKRLSFPATTANAAPFIGLFGTVWGIMDSFREIGLKGTTSLAVVAPGISEALIATAIGLATAIPAVLAYNYFMGRVKGIASKMENASIHILNQLTR
ncbi:MAG TPA: MotA/TolQ/ExbB proton channel family protein [Syntrophorhabdaceae bacterium]|nr:MotA/TolQ/ExbB proton channel family protein [Syntrophorhabdaceae bacterium]